MALIEQTSFATRGNTSILAGVTGFVGNTIRAAVRRHEERKLIADLAGKPDRLLRDIGFDPAVLGTPSWSFELGEKHAIGNRP